MYRALELCDFCLSALRYLNKNNFDFFVTLSWTTFAVKSPVIDGQFLLFLTHIMDANDGTNRPQSFTSLKSVSYNQSDFEA